MTELTDFSLDSMATCPMCPGWTINKHQKLAETALDKALIRLMDKNLYTLKELRELCTKLWNEQWFDGRPKPHTIPVSGPYWEGPKYGNRSARRIYDLTQEFEVLQPFQPYSLVLETYTIKGRYALIRKRTKGSTPLVLVPCSKEVHHRSRPESTLPALSSLAKYVHAWKTYPFRKIGIYNLPLLHGMPSSVRVIENSLATEILLDAVKVASLKPKFYVPGLHCLDCSTKPCLELLNERSNDDRWSRWPGEIPG